MNAMKSEQRAPGGKGLDQLPAEAVVGRILDGEARVRSALRRAAPTLAVAAQRFARTYEAGGRIVFVGAGTSGRLGVLEAAECPPTFGTDPHRIEGVMAGGRAAFTRTAEGREDSARAGSAAVARQRLGPGDLMVALSASGTTPYVLGAARAARQRGADTLAVTCNPGAPLLEAVDLEVVLDVGPEVVAGSTRMKAGTATKTALGTMTTTAMTLLGRIHDGYMVSLTPTSKKLRSRARSIVSNLAGVDGAATARLLKKTGNDVRLAVLLGRSGGTLRAARRCLEKYGGHLGRALSSGYPRESGPGK